MTIGLMSGIIWLMNAFITSNQKIPFLSSEMGRRPLYAIVRDTIRSRLARIEPGGRLPTGQQLAAEFGVDLITVKRALLELVNEGFIVRRRRCGTFATEKVASLKKILWVTGLELANARVSQYWFDCTRYADALLTADGYVVEHTWIPATSPEESIPYMKDELLSAYLGIVFNGCWPTHPLLRKAIELKFPHAIMTTTNNPANVRINWQQGVGLGISLLAKHGHKRIAFFGSIDKASDLPSPLPKRLDFEFFELPVLIKLPDYEHESYRATARLIAGNKLPKGILIRDEVVAKGVTRAILEASDKVPAGLEVVVMCGRQEIAPYGMPVTYVTHDTEAGVREAVRIIDGQIKGNVPDVSAVTIPFRIEK